MRVFAACSLCFLAAALCNNGQTNESKGMPPRAAPSDYQAHAQVGAVTIAAEFLGHSIPRPEGPLETEEYVAIETGLFGAANEHLKLSIEDFSLRVNGKKTPLSSQPYGLVTGSLKDPSWEPPDKPEAKSKTGINTGGGQNDNSPPPPVHVPIELRRAMALYVQKAALPEGDRALPEAGLIFFQFRGKTERLRSVELIYSGAAGKATLALQP